MSATAAPKLHIPPSLPPHDTGAERVLLSGCLKYPESLEAAWRVGVRTDAFYWHHHGTAWAGLVALYDMADHPDGYGPWPLWQWIERHANPADWGGVVRFGQWVGNVWDADPAGVRCWHAAARVRRMADWRRAIHQAREALRDAEDDERYERVIV